MTEALFIRFGFRFDRGSRNREGFQSDRDREPQQQRERDRPRVRGIDRSEPSGRGGGSGSNGNRMPPPPDRDHRDRYADSRPSSKGTWILNIRLSDPLLLCSSFLSLVRCGLHQKSIRPNQDSVMSLGNGGDRYSGRSDNWRSSSSGGGQSTSGSKNYGGSSGGGMMGNGGGSSGGSGWSQSSAGTDRWNSSSTSSTLSLGSRSLNSSSAFSGSPWANNAAPLTLSSSVYPATNSIGSLSSSVLGSSGSVSYSGDRYSRH